MWQNSATFTLVPVRPQRLICYTGIREFIQSVKTIASKCCITFLGLRVVLTRAVILFQTLSFYFITKILTSFYSVRVLGFLIAVKMMIPLPLGGAPPPVYCFLFYLLT